MTQYIGYDLGDGDALVSYRRNDGYEVIMNARMPGHTAEQQGTPMPALLSVGKYGATTIGKVAVFGSGNLVELFVNSQRRPAAMKKEEYRAFKTGVVKFTDALFLHKEFFEKTIDPADSRLVLYISRPTLWNEEDVARYQEILESCSFIEVYRKRGINVEVRLEEKARAVVLNIVKRQTAYEANVQFDDGAYAVVFNFGASTTDVTVLQREGEYKVVPWDYGDCNLGARLIDRGIYNLVLEKLDSKTQQYLKNDDFLKSKSVYICREAKERYFGYTDKERANVDWENALQAPRFFPLGWHFDGSTVREALATQWPELGGLSYKDAVRKLFTDVAKSMKEKGAQPSPIILTGGAAQMDFVHTLAREAFANATVWGAPSSCVARGLAYAAMIDEKVKRFEERVRKVCEFAEIGKIVEATAKQIAFDLSR